jgi:hypothetical protein
MSHGTARHTVLLDVPVLVLTTLRAGGARLVEECTYCTVGSLPMYEYTRLFKK